MLNKSFMKKMKESLLLQKQELLAKSTLVQEQDIDTDGDEIDEIQGNMLIELNNKLNSRNNVKLIQIDDALSRLDNNTYGICEDCEEGIPEKRLLANPYFLICVSCAEDREAEEKQRKRS